MPLQLQMRVPLRWLWSFGVILFVIVLVYELRTRYRDPFFVNFDDGSDWPVLEEQSPSTRDDKVVVMAKIKTEDTTWLTTELSDWGHAVYHMEDTGTRYSVPQNKGREAMAYLTYIIDFYDDLPATLAFIHPHNGGWPAAWHVDAPDYSNAASLQSLKIEYVQENGYVNLRCIEIPGCPDEIQPFREIYDADRTAEHAMVEAWTYMFGDNSTVPKVLATPCCSQFSVSKTQVLARPRSFYERVRKWLLETPLDDATSGRVMEYLWHTFFGKDPVHCPELESCWCKQFGRCGGW